VQATIPLAGQAEIDRAVAKAEAAFPAWRTTRASVRRDILREFARLVRAHVAEFTHFAALDGGAPQLFGQMGVHLCSEWLEYYAGLADKLEGSMLGTFGSHGEVAYSVPEPIGTVGIIITWNGPLISLGMKVAPALAAGNCVIVKPAEITPFAPDLFARLAREAGIPDGVLSVLPGTPAAGEALVRHRKVRLISFTGGPVTARKILASCAELIKPTIMELGGKSASLVFPDADFEGAAQRAVQWTIGTIAGQGCALPTRLVIHEDIYDRFIDRCVEIARTYKVGDPINDPEVMVGPLINAAACDRVVGMLERCRKEGSGRIVLGGHRCGGELTGRNYIEPTIIADVVPDSEIAQVEVFGPVLVAMKFRTEEEAVAIANSTDYGLASYIQTSDLKRAHRLAELLHAGGVYINGAFQINAHTPFGGVGISGFGKEGGRAGLDEFLHYKTVAIA
jgi:aldehyde dehydrogenase (NAD+)